MRTVKFSHFLNLLFILILSFELKQKLLSISKEGFPFIYISLLDEQRSAAFKLGKKKNFCIKWKGPNPASFWPDTWPDCLAVLKKNEFCHCLESGQESGRKSGRIVTWHVGHQL